MGIDFGRARIGIALSDETELIAGGLCTLHLSVIKSPSDTVRDLVLENEVKKIVIGCPYKSTGERGDLFTDIEIFANELKSKVDVDIEYVDESYTSDMAHTILRERKMKRKMKKEKGHVDRVAACFILQSYLDTKKR